jgi:hypothetical protein
LSILGNQVTPPHPYESNIQDARPSLVQRRLSKNKHKTDFSLDCPPKLQITSIMSLAASAGASSSQKDYASPRNRFSSLVSQNNYGWSPASIPKDNNPWAKLKDGFYDVDQGMLLSHEDSIETKVMQYLDSKEVRQVNVPEYLRDTRIHKVVRKPKTLVN